MNLIVTLFISYKVSSLMGCMTSLSIGGDPTYECDSKFIKYYSIPLHGHAITVMMELLSAQGC